MPSPGASGPRRRRGSRGQPQQPGASSGPPPGASRRSALPQGSMGGRAPPRCPGFGGPYPETLAEEREERLGLRASAAVESPRQMPSPRTRCRCEGTCPCRPAAHPAATARSRADPSPRVSPPPSREAESLSGILAKGPRCCPAVGGAGMSSPNNGWLRAATPVVAPAVELLRSGGPRSGRS